METILTYNGNECDYELLHQYWDPNTKWALESEFEEKHVDIFEKVQDRTGERLSYEGALDWWGISTPKVEVPDTMDVETLNGNVYKIGKSLITDKKTPQPEIDALQNYAINDVEPLVRLFRNMMLQYSPSQEN